MSMLSKNWKYFYCFLKKSEIIFCAFEKSENINRFSEKSESFDSVFEFGIGEIRTAGQVKPTFGILRAVQDFTLAFSSSIGCPRNM